MHKPKIGAKVVITKKGLAEHIGYQETQGFLTGAAAGAFLLPMLIPSAGIGIVGGGFGIGVSEAAQAVVGGVIGGSFGKNYEKDVVLASIGVVKELQRRWWGQEGWDVRVEWCIEKPDGSMEYLDQWHDPKHLVSVRDL